MKRRKWQLSIAYVLQISFRGKASRLCNLIPVEPKQRQQIQFPISGLVVLAKIKKKAFAKSQKSIDRPKTCLLSLLKKDVR